MYSLRIILLQRVIRSNKQTRKGFGDLYTRYTASIGRRRRRRRRRRRTLPGPTVRRLHYVYETLATAYTDQSHIERDTLV